MSAARRTPVYNQDDPTVIAGAARKSPPVSANAIVRGTPLVIRTSAVPIVYDAEDDGEPQRTELMSSPLASAGQGYSGGTALMPAATPPAHVSPHMPTPYNNDMRGAVLASMNHLQAQRRTPSPSASGIRPRPAAAPAPAGMMGLSRFEVIFAVSAAVVVGLAAALLFVYFG